MKRKILSTLLALCLCIGLFPNVAFAASGDMTLLSNYPRSATNYVPKWDYCTAEFSKKIDSSRCPKATMLNITTGETYTLRTERGSTEHTCLLVLFNGLLKNNCQYTVTIPANSVYSVDGDVYEGSVQFSFSTPYDSSNQANMQPHDDTTPEVVSPNNTPSAESSPFKDYNSINPQYIDAINYAVEHTILSGYTDGNFNPTAGLTRGAATKIVASIELGAATATKLVASKAPFPDVSVNHVFAGYIGYCSEKGYINGYSDNTFKPAAPLTRYAFAKMLLKSTNTSQPSNTYVGSTWKADVYRDATIKGIFPANMGFENDQPVTREEAAFLAYNAICNKDVKVPYVPEETPIDTPAKETSGITNQLPISAPISDGLSFSFEINRFDGVSVFWKAQNNSGKTINYYTIRAYFYNAVGDPAYDKIKGTAYRDIRVVGPINPGSNLLLANVVGYVPVCDKIKFGEVKLEYSDGTTEEFWYGWSTSTER